MSPESEISSSVGPRLDASLPRTCKGGVYLEAERREEVVEVEVEDNDDSDALCRCFLENDNFKILKLSFSQHMSSQVKIYKKDNVSKFSSYALAPQNPGARA